MLGITVTKESALTELDAMEDELRAEIRSFANNRLMPTMPAAFQAWIERHERRLAALEVFRALVLARPDNAVLLEDV